jgi:hypothetical protein
MHEILSPTELTLCLLFHLNSESKIGSHPQHAVCGICCSFDYQKPFYLPFLTTDALQSESAIQLGMAHYGFQDVSSILLVQAGYSI